LRNPRLLNRGFLFWESSKVVYMRLSWSLALGLLLGACGSPPQEMQQKLQEIGRADLDIIVHELSDTARSEALLARPHFVVDEYKEFKGDTAREFQAYASLVFFYLDSSLDLCQVRKYRYNRSSRTWERFDVVLEHVPPKYAGKEDADSGTSEESAKP